jgi:MoxR-like ATPase
MEEQSEGASSVAAVAAIRQSVVGRDRELELILATVESGRDLILEGPPGTSKTTILKAITSAWGIPLVMVEGNAELTPARLLGHHDPARVLSEGYGEETFEPGPLVEAMRSGGFLYFEEFNRAPEDTLNTLLTAIADRELTLPRVGTVHARPSFRLIGSMNPYDNVGTTRLSVSIRDRLCRFEIGYQPAAAECEVVALRCGIAPSSAFARRLVDDAVAVTRATREHEAVSQGSSIRGAIDLQLMGARLCALREIEGEDDARYPDSFFEAMLVTLSGRLLLDQATGVDAKTVLREIWEDQFLLRARGGDGGIPVEVASSGEDRPGRESLAPRSRRGAKPKTLTEEPNLMTSSGGFGLAAGRGREPRAPGRRPPTKAGATDEEGELQDDGDPHPAETGAVRAAAQEIAARLAARRPPPPTARRGSGEIHTSPSTGGGEIDLDRTLDVIAAGLPLRTEDILVRERRRHPRSLVLAVDASGSMHGERLRTAAATVGAVSSEFARDHLAVIAFWSDAALLLRFGERATLEDLVDAMLGLSASGLTNISFPLETARTELLRSSGQDHRVVLLSDCLHNAGADPVGAAAGLPRLDVLFETSGASDPELAAEMARRGRGLVKPIRNYRDVAPAINEIFAN